MINGKPLSELTVEGVHACLCGILNDAVESGLLDHNSAWRTYKYSNIDKKQQVVADEEILQKPATESCIMRWRYKITPARLA